MHYRLESEPFGRIEMNGDPDRSETDETRELLVRAQAGDRRACDDLFARHRAMLRRVVAGRIGPLLRRRIDPSDVVQDAQVDALERLADYIQRRPMPFRLWLIRTAVERLLKVRRHALATRRNIGRERPLHSHAIIDRPARITLAGTTPSQHLAAREQAIRLSEYLERLPECDRTILRMRAIEGLTYDEAGAALAIEPAAARKRYGRALLRLRTLLLAEGLTESHL
jgi:RNA polymerase sigma-70 factor (ECF subfamily)